MPIFEYECQACRHQFEQLVTSTFPEPEACPKCKKKKLERMISQVTVSSDSIRQANAQSSIREQKRKYKDKAVADAEYREKELHDH
jgi:putative FmdB family regulatory protein